VQDANSEAAKELLEEAELMRQLEFVNVVRCLGVSEKNVDESSIFVLLEFMALGDLHTRLGKDGRDMRLAERLWYCHQIAQGMAYLSMKGAATGHVFSFIRVHG
jgi:serine/threonine protein kinase